MPRLLIGGLLHGHEQNLRNWQKWPLSQLKESKFLIEIFGWLSKNLNLGGDDGGEFAREDQAQCAHQACVVSECRGKDRSGRQTTAENVRGDRAPQFVGYQRPCPGDVAG